MLVPAATEATETGSGLVQAGERRSVRLESVRAVAALAVIVVHAYGYANGYRPSAIFSTYYDRLVSSTADGVDLFFALSGYLLFLPFAQHWWGSGSRPDVGRYARNRALRILPLYYVVIVVYLIVGSASRSQTLHFLTFTQDFFSNSVQRIDGPTWSIVAEVEFYALLPVVAWAIGRVSRRSVAAGFLALGVLTAVTFAVRLSIGPASPLTWQYSPATNAFFFLPGMVLALVRCARPERVLDRLPGLLRRSDLWVALAVGLWMLHAWRWSHDELLGVASFLVLGACVLPLDAGLLVAVLDMRVLGWLGMVSYSMYMWHDPVVHALSGVVPGGFPGLLAVSVPVSVAIAGASYLLIERPFLLLRRAWSGRAAQAVPRRRQSHAG